MNGFVFNNLLTATRSNLWTALIQLIHEFLIFGVIKKRRALAGNSDSKMLIKKCSIETSNFRDNWKARLDLELDWKMFKFKSL